MKLSLSLLQTASYCAPERKKQNKLRIDRLVSPVPCNEINRGTPFTSLDNGESGQVTFDSYVENVYCYVDIGASCGAEGIEVEITHIEMEVYFYYNYADNSPYYAACYDSIHFTWLKSDGKTVEQTDLQCGCLDEYHPSCNDHPFYDHNMAVTERPTQYNLVGTDVKIVLISDRTFNGGKV